MKRSSRISLVLVASASAVALAGCDGETSTQNDIQVTNTAFTNRAECVQVYDAATCDAAEKKAKEAFIADAPQFASRAECEAEFGAAACTPASTYAAGTPAASNSNANNIFVPMMIGYMLGNGASSPIYGDFDRDRYYRDSYYRDSYYQRQLERERRERERERRSGSVYGGSGGAYNVTNKSSPAQVGKTTAAQPSTSFKGNLKSTTALQPPVSQRGGFGATGGNPQKATVAVPASAFKPTPVSTPRSSWSSNSGSSRSYAGSPSSSRSYSVGASSRGGFGGSARGFSAGG